MAMNRFTPTSNDFAPQDLPVPSQDEAQLLQRNEYKEFSQQGAVTLGMESSTSPNDMSCQRSSCDPITEFPLSDFGPRSLFRFLETLYDQTQTPDHRFNHGLAQTLRASGTKYGQSHMPITGLQDTKIAKLGLEADKTHIRKGKARSYGQDQESCRSADSSSASHAANEKLGLIPRAPGFESVVHAHTSILKGLQNMREVGSSDKPDTVSRAATFERYTDDRRRLGRSQFAHAKSLNPQTHNEQLDITPGETEIARPRKTVAKGVLVEAEDTTFSKRVISQISVTEARERNREVDSPPLEWLDSNVSAAGGVVGSNPTLEPSTFEQISRAFDRVRPSLSSLASPMNTPEDRIEVDADDDGEDEYPYDEVSLTESEGDPINRDEDLPIHCTPSDRSTGKIIQVNNADDDDSAIAKRRVFTNYQNFMPEDLQNRCLKTFSHHKRPHSESHDTISEVADATFRRLHSKDHEDAPPKFCRYWFSSNTGIIPPKRSDPPHLPPPAAPIQGFPLEFWSVISVYLSSSEIRTLRLVNKRTARELAPYVFRSSVVKFGPRMFECSGDEIQHRFYSLPASSMLYKYGENINKFGISFDIDQLGLAYAPSKEIQESVISWFGNYTWPVDNYPRFRKIKIQEDLVDSNSKLLKESLGCLPNVSELGLSVDSGHGWLPGTDISDLALLKQRLHDGPKVFGKAFGASDKAAEYAIREYFTWAQINSLEATHKALAQNQDPELKDTKSDLERMQIRHYDQYLCQDEQTDHNANCHIGLTTDRRPWPVQNAGRTFDFDPMPSSSAAATQAAIDTPLVTRQLGPATWRQTSATSSVRSHSHSDVSRQATGALSSTDGLEPQTAASTLMSRALARARLELDIQNSVRGLTSEMKAAASVKPRSRFRKPQIPQWPLIFSCQNVAAFVGGTGQHIQRKVARAADSPLLPGILREAQAQWLMETLWAQRSFLAAYASSVITSKQTLKNVHSLHISQISANLLSSLEQKEFWSSLQSLRNVTLLVIPDWRQEHLPGDKSFISNMSINPVESSAKLFHILKHFVAPLENISVLSIGFVGGGEHATGIFARNNYVLPAPISNNPRSWVGHESRDTEPSALVTFNHVRELTFQNCWFSPLMLKTFVQASRDTSLHHLTLDSVSLTGRHNLRATGSMTWAKDKATLKCAYLPEEWVFERVTPDHCWVNILEKATPGKTMFEYKCETGVINDPAIIEEHGQAEFRGHVETITLKSCGYVEISGIDATDFAQHGLMRQSRELKAFDNGLRARLISFQADDHMASGISDNEDEGSGERPFMQHPQDAIDFIHGASEHRSVMMVPRDLRTGKFFFGLGKLTSCVHPVEQRILEQGWGMTFGWGDDMERWAAVEDGHCEGGTGRFSGVVSKTSINDVAAAAAAAAAAPIATADNDFTANQM